MLRYGTVTMEFIVTSHKDRDYAILTTDKGERVYLPRAFIESAQSEWDSGTVSLDDPGDIYARVMALI